MKGFKSLGMKIALGFGTLIFIMLILGVTASFKMWGVKTESMTLDREYVPEVKVANNLERFSLQMMYNMTGYGLSEDKGYLEEGMKNLEEVKQHIMKAKELAARSPHLVKLREAMPDIEAEFSEYEKLVSETVKRNEQIAKNRQQLDEAATKYMESCYNFLTHQTEALEAAMVAGFKPDKLAERLMKITLANNVIDMANETRVLNFKSQALRDPQLIRDVQKNFDRMERKFQEILSLTRLEENIKEINDTRTAAHAYKNAMDDLLKNWLAVQELGKQRNATAEQVLENAQAAAMKGMSETEKIANQSVSSLSSAFMIVMIGVLISVIVGVTAAVLITRAVTKPLGEIVDMANRIARGDLSDEIAIRREDEIGDLADAFRNMQRAIEDQASVAQRIADGDLSVEIDIRSDKDVLAKSMKNVADTLQTLQNELARLTQASKDGELSERGRPDQFRGEYAEVVQGINEMLDATLRPINEVIRVLNLIRGGNLREKVETECKGDHENMKNAVNGVHAWLTGLVDYVTGIANGDMAATMEKASDEDQIHEWLMLMKNNIRELTTDIDGLAGSAVEGNLTVRGEPAKHNGEYANVIQGVNRVIDSLVGHLDAMPAPAFIIDRDFSIRYVNKIGSEFVGMTQESLIGSKCYACFKLSDCRSERCAVDRCMHQGHPVTSEAESRARDKKIRCFLYRRSVKRCGRQNRRRIGGYDGSDPGKACGSSCPEAGGLSERRG